MRSTKAIIHLENLQHNIKQIKSFTKPGTKMLIPVKANAYGHGTVECAKAAIEAGVDVLAVATVEEGILLRKNGIKTPLLLFSLCAIDEVEDAVRNAITPFVFDEEYIQMFQDAAKNLNVKKFAVHLAVDSGMGRIGCYKEEAAQLAKFIESCENLTLGGMCTHFAVSDSKSKENNAYTQQQYKNFTDAIEAVKGAGINPGICHCCNSAATLDHPEMHLDLVRPGIIVYGYDADEVNAKYLTQKGTPCQLKPVMTLESEVCAIRKFSKGMSVGYGRTWEAKEDTNIAVIPIGYGDGFLRRNAQNGIKVAINGKEYPIVGRICMDQCMVDIGNNSDVKRWDRVVIFGQKEDGALQTADDIARITGTISYEITTDISSRVERIYTK